MKSKVGNNYAWHSLLESKKNDVNLVHKANIQFLEQKNNILRARKNETFYAFLIRDGIYFPEIRDSRGVRGISKRVIEIEDRVTADRALTFNGILSEGIKIDKNKSMNEVISLFLKEMI